VTRSDKNRSSGLVEYCEKCRVRLTKSFRWDLFDSNVWVLFCSIDQGRITELCLLWKFGIGARELRAIYSRKSLCHVQRRPSMRSEWLCRVVIQRVKSCRSRDRCDIETYVVIRHMALTQPDLDAW
jgi:hypothetical protein